MPQNSGSFSEVLFSILISILSQTDQSEKLFANYSSINHCNEIAIVRFCKEIAIADDFVPIYNEPHQFNDSMIEHF